MSMQFVIKPNDDSLNLLLEASGYQRAWAQHGPKIRRAFRNVTGLDFQQDLIDARVFADTFGSAGTTDEPMHLPVYYDDDTHKILTLIHELSHRLLGGNALSPVGLGLLPDEPGRDVDYQEYEHRHTYLFEYDVVQQALGDEIAALCRTVEEANNIDGPHDHAWAWAMSLDHEQRQRAIKRLAAEALPRSRWHERDDIEVVPRDPATWFESLRK
jgi:hypothetical protein